jgi:molybdate transport system regulatory protein
MKISARNQLDGTVESITDGAVSAIVTIRLSGGDLIVASITKESVANLGLRVGASATAAIKASDVIVATE